VNGSWINSEIDLAYQLFGEKFSFQRTFNSFRKHNRGFGYGWSHNFDMHLQRNFDNSYYFIDAEGRGTLLKRKRGVKEYTSDVNYFPEMV
jgi:hypothetical protein